MARLLTFIGFLSFCAVLSQAHGNDDIFTSGLEFPRVGQLSWLSQHFLAKQRQRVDALTRSSFGKPLGNADANLDLLQRVIDNALIASADTGLLQALGVILGDIFVEKNKSLVWQAYQDELGVSHAVCLRNSKHCLFPITMLSRRMEVGLKPRVRQIYNKGLKALQPYMAKLPYQD